MSGEVSFLPWIEGGIKARDGDGGSAPFEWVNLDPQNFGTYWYTSWQLGGDGRLQLIETLEATQGLRMGGIVHALNPSADDYDNFNSSAEGGIWFTYTPSASGRLEVYLEIENFYDNNYRSLVNEWGDSECLLNQYTTLTLGSFDGNTPVGRSSLLLDMKAYDGNGSEGSGGGWIGSFQNFYPGERRTIRYNTKLKVEAGKPIDLSVGIKAEIWGFLNDVSALIYQGSGWSLKSMLLTIRP
jgi:hypothetical protein